MSCESRGNGIFGLLRCTSVWLILCSMVGLHAASAEEPQRNPGLLARWVAPPRPEEVNLAPNPSFEDFDDSGKPRGYSIHGEGKTDIAQAHTGRASLKLSGGEVPANFRYCPRRGTRGYDFKVGDVYRISLWSKALDPDKGARAYQLCATICDPKAGHKISYHGRQFTRATHDWEKRTVEVKIEKAGCYLRDIYGIYIAKSGTVWFDDLEVLRVRRAARPETTAVVAPKRRRMLCCPKLPSAPVIDGKLNDACWQRAALAGDFVLGNGQAPTQATTCRMGHDARCVYFGFECRESQAGRIKTDVKKRDGQVWTDDSVEIFLDTNYDRDTYFHLIANAIGTKFDSKRGEGGHSRTPWDGKWQCAAVVGDAAWTIEVAVPFGTLGAKAPALGTKWGFNVAREEQPMGEVSSWAPMGRRLHQPQLFADLFFGAYPAELAARLEALRRSTQETAADAAARLAPDSPQKASLILAKERVLARLDDIAKRITAAGDLTSTQWERFDEELSAVTRDVARLKFLDQPYIVWHKNPLLSFSPNELPAGAAAEINRLYAPAYIGEYEAAAFMVSNLSDRTLTGRVTLGDLMPPAHGPRFSRDRITLRVTSFVETRAGKLVPDALVALNEADEITVPPGETRQVWLIMDARDAAPGEYSGTILLKPYERCFPAKEVRVTLHVLPLTLPEGVPQVILWRTPMDAEVAELDDLIAHRVNVFIVDPIPRPRADAEGNLLEEPDLSKLRKAAMRVKGHGTLLLSMAINEPWYHSFPGVKLEFLSPHWKKAFRSFVAAEIACLKECGYGYDEFAYYLKDEPYGKYLDQAAECAREIKKVDPRVMIFENPSGPYDATALEAIKRADAVVDIWCPYIRRLQHEKAKKEAAFYRAVAKKGKAIWCYDCGVGTKAYSPLGWYRKKGWFAWQKGLPGFGFWSYNCMYNDVWDDYDHLERGDASVVYSRGPNPIPSRRWEAFRDGVEDYCCLYLLDKVIAKAGKKGLDVSEARALLNRSTSAVLDSRDADVVYRQRALIADATLKLNALMKFDVGEPSVKADAENVTISWKTSEACTGAVYYRERDSAHWTRARTPQPSVEPTVRIAGLTPGRTYLYYVCSTNDAGFTIVNDNRGACYRWSCDNR